VPVVKADGGQVDSIAMGRLHGSPILTLHRAPYGPVDPIVKVVKLTARCASRSSCVTMAGSGVGRPYGFLSVDASGGGGLNLAKNFSICARCTN
jgi:hypothetical protein